VTVWNLLAIGATLLSCKKFVKCQPVQVQTVLAHQDCIIPLLVIFGLTIPILRHQNNSFPRPKSCNFVFYFWLKI